MAKSPETAAKAKPAAEKKTAAKPAKTAGGGARGGIAAPVTVSADLHAIVGKPELPRSEVVSKVWEYIKAHNLQDAKDKRTINADAKLEKVFGRKSATMFEMNKLLSAHMKAKKA